MKKHPNIFITSVLVVCSVLLVSVVIKVTMGNSSPEVPPPGNETLPTALAASLSNGSGNQSLAEDSEFAGAPEAAPQRGGRGGMMGGDQRQRGRGTGGDTTGDPGVQRQGMAGRFADILNDPNAMQQIQRFTGEQGIQFDPAQIQAFLGGGDQGRGGRGQPGGRPTTQVTRDRNEPDPNDPMVAINLPNVQMQTIVERLSQWTGKAIVPGEDALDERISIYSAERVPRSEALNLIYAALRDRGIIAEETEDAIYLKDLDDAKQIPVPTVAADEPLALLANKDQIVQKFFEITYYMPSQIQQVILEMVNDFGYVAADDGNRILIVIDTVANLQRIEKTLQILDVPAGSAQTVTRSIPVIYGDPAEIVQMIQMLMSAEGMGTSSSSSSNQGRGRGRGSSTTSVVISPFQSSSNNRNSRNSRNNQSSGNLVGASNLPIVLIPEPTSNQIIARGHPDDLDQIEQWVRQFDQPGMAEADPDYSTIKVKFVNVLELADQISETVAQMPGSAITTSIRVLPLVQSNTLLVFGSQEARELIQKLVLEIDIPADKFIVEHFKLIHADPVEISAYLLDLYMGQGGTSGAGSILSSMANIGRMMGGGRGGTSGIMGALAGVAGGGESDMVRAIPYPSLKQITVIASAENMKKIALQIDEWDQPLDIEAVKPLIISVKNSDPVLMADFLNRLFSSSQGSNAMTGMMFGNTGRGGINATTQQMQYASAVIGPLYGKLTFEPVPDAKKIVVISQNPGALTAVKEFVEELDRQETAELPIVVPLSYADPEDLAQRLNAMLNPDGSTATINLTAGTLSSYTSGATSSETGTGIAPESAGEAYQPWWNTGGGANANEQPISTLIGKVRFIPDRRSKAIMYLAPPEYSDEVKAWIQELDKPAKQVMIEAIILEVTHESMTSLGVQFATDPTAFGALGEQALSDLSTLFYADTFGAIDFSSALNVTTLVDFLVKETDAKILNQPKVWAKDNEQATFFNGGTVPFIASSQSSAEGFGVETSFDQLDVGVTLRVKPNITDTAVELIVNLIISQLEPGLILGNTSTSETNTTTQMIIEDNKTVLLSGILLQKDTKIEHKFPLLGDIPLLGELFKHYETEKTNSELLVFITPHVINPDKIGQEASTIEAVEKLDRIKAELDAWMMDGK
ncbi:MAG: hypothetical protein GY869_23420 [Planctomycetes bacterium]|nr:hypothetical protein [Planctomycetota bacterium]